MDDLERVAQAEGATTTRKTSASGRPILRVNCSSVNAESVSMALVDSPEWDTHKHLMMGDIIIIWDASDGITLTALPV